MEKQSLVLDIRPDGTVKLPSNLRRNLGNPEQLGVTRVGASLVLGPVPETWQRGKGHVIFYENGLIARNPKIMFGTLVITGTRIPIRTIAGYIESGYSAAQIREELPQLTNEQIAAALRFYRGRRKHPRRER